ncbi:MAG: hypothetical protein WEE67_01325 [Chloroflexota bacterium]
MEGEVPNSPPSEEVEIDYLLLADYAEVLNNKMYLMGGGWDNFAPSSYPAEMRWGVAVGIRVPFLESNRPIHFVLTMRGDGGQEHFRIEGDLETGRPPGSKGESILAPLAINGTTQLIGPNLLEIVATIDGKHSRRISVRARPARDTSPGSKPASGA